MLEFLYCYLAVANCAAFLMGWWDKRCARKGKWRVPERTLFFAALIGGAGGMLLAMLLFRHKTRHWYFMIGIPVILVAQIALLALLILRQ